MEKMPKLFKCRGGSPKSYLNYLMFPYTCVLGGIMNDNIIILLSF